jgi:ubiquitin carboxyl-terminal hydrolase 34
MRIYSNSTVYELRKEVGKQFKVTWDQVKLTRNLSNKEIKDSENGRTLGDIRIRNGETLVASKRPTPPIPQASFVLEDDSVNPLARKIFVDWFTFFSKDGKMNPKNCADFIHSCTGDYCKADDRRVKEVFATYDKDHDGFLSLDDFLEFYISAARSRPSVVWNNLAAHHYRNDLKKASEVEEETIDTKCLPRFIISTNEAYFNEIFTLLDFGGKIATSAWRLINRLPTSPQLFADIIALKGIRDAADKKWDLVLDSVSTYKLLYALHVMEFLMEEEEQQQQQQGSAEEGKNNSEEGGTSAHFFIGNDPKQLEFKKNWRADFIVYGGFDHLFKIFNHYVLKDHSKLSVFDKNIMSFILKILKNYLVATFQSSTPNLYRSLSFVRLFHLSLDFITDYVNAEKKKKEEEEAGGKGGDQAVESMDDAAAQSQGKDKSKADEKKREKFKIEETDEFLKLVDSLKGDLGKQILSTIHLDQFVKLVSTLGYEVLNLPNDPESEDRMILEYSLTTLIGILLYDQKYLTAFLSNSSDSKAMFPDSANYILKGIFYSKSLNIRKIFSHAIYVLSKNTLDRGDAFAAEYFIELLLQNLPGSDDDSKKDCNQYFDILCKLIEETYAKQGDQKTGGLNFESLIELVIKRIKSHVSSEKRNNLHVNDKIYIGLLSLCEKILTVKPELREIVGDKARFNLVEEIFNASLFDVKERESAFKDLIGDNDPNSFSSDYVKCKSKDSRVIAYRLLITLCSDSPANSGILMNCLGQLMGTISKLGSHTSWGYSPAADTKSFYGFVGLKNLGCICYMNAMLQQFFMTPAFRYGIMMADDGLEPNMVKKDNKWDIDDNMIHQLQKMCGFLELSDRQDYNPFEFCFSFKDMTGAPVNVSVQQDTQEFLNMIFDKLERLLKHSPFSHITESVYGGRNSNQLICHGCGKVRDRIETFYTLSLEVRNMKTIYDSLDKYIMGETIDDYYCDECKKKNSITKRTCIDYLPNVMIVHLQRIVFDLDTLMNQKINSRLEFPHELNLEPYTKEGLEWREKAKKKKEKKKGGAGGAAGGGDGDGDDKGADEDKGVDDEEMMGEIPANKEQAVEEEDLGPYKLHS